MILLDNFVFSIIVAGDNNILDNSATVAEIFTTKTTTPITAVANAIYN